MISYHFADHHGEPSHNSNYDEDHQLPIEPVNLNLCRTLNKSLVLVGGELPKLLVNTCLNVNIADLAN